MKRILILFSFIFVICSGSINPYDAKMPLKIMIVNSYSHQHPCSTPQYNGFLEHLALYKNKFHFIIRGHDMDAKLVNTTPEKMQDRANMIISQIEKFAPDLIFTTDDVACKYVGIPMSTKYKVYSSGLNKHPNQYIEENKLNPKVNDIYFVSEYIRLDGLWSLLKQNNVMINDVYIIVEPLNQLPPTSYYFLENYKAEFNGKISNTHYIHVETVKDLKSKLTELDKKDKTLVVVVVQRVKDDNGQYIDKAKISEIISYTGKNHLYLGANNVFCKTGMTICIAPDFYDMGYVAGKSAMIRVLYEKNMSNIIYDKPLTVYLPKSTIVVNKNNLLRAGFGNLLSNTSLIDDIY